MKKFFGKLPVMITFIALAVVMAAVYIGMLVRPAAIGFAYKGEGDFFGSGEKQEVSLVFKNDEVVRTTIHGKEDKVVVDMWVYRDGNEVLLCGLKKVVEADETVAAMLKLEMGGEMDEKTYNDVMVKMYEDLKEKDEKAYEELLKENDIEVNAFKMTMDNEEYTCTGSVVFAIVGGIVELVLLAGAGLAVFYKVKK